MNYKEYTKLLKTQIPSVPYAQQLKFAVLVCEKLYVNYQKFYEAYKWGDPNVLMDAIIVCQKALGNPCDKNEIKTLLPKIDHITPHMDDFGSEIGSYALNASAAVYETLEFITDKNHTHIYNIANYYTDTIDFKIQEERTLSEEEIENHPLMIDAWTFVIEQTKSAQSTRTLSLQNLSLIFNYFKRRKKQTT